ncbi:CBS domain-containing protein [Rhodoblastus acidophilus]|jgi:CBS domain-containing protein|uniref:CBS domain-containing protein n=1 Tax=Candidatus Rhodoblastus alkanivorans TaxID=2954117 RepID=A0ABS9Z9M0_9HYPH|nr:CBS domain-containing protein [Candidatus Rhodoblastus alkanivorans]MCI4679992.1 CBS domain-containing protein [Candidatus Rhodoblastus alkanivorans]MCI4684266.1 CBS domain-containing protein [Candidatus Rhodoblastus alkanivorans]MDI4641586.1 CBS domain-containing protein [Rhodoblastus acidophilus]
MSVALIIAAKGNDVTTTQPHRTMQEATALLAEKKIGAVIVTGDDGGVLGILSERDIVRAVGLHGCGVLQDPVSKYMTGRVVTTSMDESIDQVMEQMTAGRFRHLPVIKEGRLAGVISIGDVVKHRLDGLESEHRAMREYIATA